MKYGISTIALVAALSTVAGGALAQSPLVEPPPARTALDWRNVDLVTGVFTLAMTDVSIGPEDGGLSYGRTWIGNGYRDSLTVTANLTGSVLTISVGSFSDPFNVSGSTYTPVTSRGQTLTKSGSTLTYTSSDGTIYTFGTPTSAFVDRPSSNQGTLQNIKSPNGQITNYVYRSQSVVTPGGFRQNFSRLQSVYNNNGYQIFFDYEYDSAI